MSSPNVSTNVAKQRQKQGLDPSLTTQFVTAEEMKHVDKSFDAQRKLSFSFGFVFFLVTLLIPFLGGTAEWWYGKQLIGGLTLNFVTTLLLFHVFYWTLAYLFVKRANRLDDDIKQGNF
jgi:uncharacterized membrane protein (DUF485 family)